MMFKFKCKSCGAEGIQIADIASKYSKCPVCGEGELEMIYSAGGQGDALLLVEKLDRLNRLLDIKIRRAHQARNEIKSMNPVPAMIQTTNYLYIHARNSQN